MQLNPYLTFNGQRKAAFKFYEKVLGGKIEAIPYANNGRCERRLTPTTATSALHPLCVKRRKAPRDTISQRLTCPVNEIGPDSHGACPANIGSAQP